MRVRVETEEQIERVTNNLRYLALSEGPQSVEILPWVPMKTTSQVAHIHAIIRDIAKAFHEHPKVTKVRMKDFLGFYEVGQRKDGSEFYVYKSFKEASKEEMSEMISRLQVVAVENDIPLRDKA